jgi:DNA polymerase III delta prime subunit
MFDEIYASLNKKIDQEIQSTTDNDLIKYSENKFANIKMMISDFSIDSTVKKQSIKEQNWQENLQKNKDFKKLKEYIENLKIELYSQESTVSALKEKLRISENQIEEERKLYQAEISSTKEEMLSRKKEWQSKMDKVLQDKKEMGLKCEEMVDYISQLVKSKKKM